MHGTGVAVGGGNVQHTAPGTTYRVKDDGSTGASFTFRMVRVTTEVAFRPPWSVTVALNT